MNNTLKLVISVATPLAVGGLSGYATARGVADWYPTLTKPSFNPPAWVFGPAWTVLYIMMGVAAFLVWRKGLDADGVRIALTAFAIQLALNGLWSILFFGMQAPGWALVEIILLWIAIGITTRALLAGGVVGGSTAAAVPGMGQLRHGAQRVSMVAQPLAGGLTYRLIGRTGTGSALIGYEPHDLLQALRCRRGQLSSSSISSGWVSSRVRSTRRRWATSCGPMSIGPRPSSSI